MPKEKIPTRDEMYGAALRRVDYFMVNILNGMLGDGELSLNRIDAEILLDKAENLAWKAMERCEQITQQMICGEGPE